MEIEFIYRKKLLCNNSIEELFDGIIKHLNKTNISIKKVELPQSGASPTAILKNLYFLFKRRGDKIYHITGDVHYAVLCTSRSVILTIHDVQSSLQGNFIKQIVVKIFWYWIPAFLAKKITVISQFSKDEVEKVIPFAKKKIIVIPNPVNNLICYSPKTFNEAYPRILHLGTKSNKNLEGTIQALEKINCHLSIIGDLTDEQKKLLSENNIDYSNKYHISLSEVLEEYIKADLVCFASFYEGFGMPIIEAQKIGRPVITSNMASMPEVAGKGACLVNPQNIEEITEAINRIVKDENYRNNLIAQGMENVKRFEINHIVAQYIDVYESISN